MLGYGALRSTHIHVYTACFIVLLFDTAVMGVDVAHCRFTRLAESVFSYPALCAAKFFLWRVSVYSASVH